MTEHLSLFAIVCLHKLQDRCFTGIFVKPIKVEKVILN